MSDHPTTGDVILILREGLDYVNFRNDPGGGKIGEIKRGARITVLDDELTRAPLGTTQYDWLPVRLNWTEGWIAWQSLGMDWESAEGLYDLADALIGDGRAYRVRNNRGGSEIMWTLLRQDSGTAVQVKNDKAEVLTLGQIDIGRPLDTSPEQSGMVYTAVGPVVKRHVRKEERFPVRPLITWHYLSGGGVVPSSQLNGQANPYRHNGSEVLAEFYPQYTFEQSQITVPNVYEIWGYLGDTLIEKKWYASGYGLVGFYAVSSKLETWLDSGPLPESVKVQPAFEEWMQPYLADVAPQRTFLPPVIGEPEPPPEPQPEPEPPDHVPAPSGGAVSLAPNPTLIGPPTDETLIGGRNVAWPGDPQGNDVGYRLWLQSKGNYPPPYVYNMPGDAVPGYKFEINSIQGLWGLVLPGSALPYIGGGRYAMRFRVKAQKRVYPENLVNFGPSIDWADERYQFWPANWVSMPSGIKLVKGQFFPTFNLAAHAPEPDDDSRSGQYEVVFDLWEPHLIKQFAFLWWATFAGTGGPGVTLDVSAILEHWDIVKVRNTYQPDTRPEAEWRSVETVFKIGTQYGPITGDGPEPSPDIDWVNLDNELARLENVRQSLVQWRSIWGPD